MTTKLDGVGGSGGRGAAAAGDFGEWPSDDAVRLNCAVEALYDPSAEDEGDAAAPMAGLITMWLNIAAQWALFLLYEWTLVAPLLYPGRDFS